MLRGSKAEEHFFPEIQYTITLVKLKKDAISINDKYKLDKKTPYQSMTNINSKKRRHINQWQI